MHNKKANQYVLSAEICSSTTFLTANMLATTPTSPVTAAENEHGDLINHTFPGQKFLFAELNLYIAIYMVCGLHLPVVYFHAIVVQTACHYRPAQRKICFIGASAYYLQKAGYGAAQWTHLFNMFKFVRIAASSDPHIVAY